MAPNDMSFVLLIEGNSIWLRASFDEQPDSWLDFISLRLWSLLRIGIAPWRQYTLRVARPWSLVFFQRFSNVVVLLFPPKLLSLTLSA